MLTTDIEHMETLFALLAIYLRNISMVGRFYVESKQEYLRLWEPLRKHLNQMGHYFSGGVFYGEKICEFEWLDYFINIFFRVRTQK